MNIEIVQGKFDEAREYCESKIKETIFLIFHISNQIKKQCLNLTDFCKN